MSETLLELFDRVEEECTDCDVPPFVGEKALSVMEMMREGVPFEDALQKVVGDDDPELAQDVMEMVWRAWRN